MNNYHEAVDDWPLIDPRKLDCKGRENEVFSIISVEETPNINTLAFYVSKIN